ncbi:MAG: hypothetical protein WBJ54_10945 [Syntrophorhabdus sp.]
MFLYYSFIVPRCYHFEKRVGVRPIMHDILPEGEDLRRAIKWISGSIQENTRASVSQLVEEATFKFDLSPKDSEFLMNFFRNRKEEQ